VDSHLANALLDELYTAFGQHSGRRVSHAKELMVFGSFRPTNAAGQLSTAWHLSSPDASVLVRFSNFSGIPTTPDTAPEASPRGIAVRFHQPGQPSTDVVAHTYDGFPAATPEEFLEFLEFLQATNASTTGQRTDALTDYLNRHPAARAFVETPPDPDTPYLHQRYYGVNTFVLIDQDDVGTPGRYRVQPVGTSADKSTDQPGLHSEQPQHNEDSDPDVRRHELEASLARGPSYLDLVFQLAAPDDDLLHGSTSWPHTGPDRRPEVVLGTLRLEAVVDDSLELNLAFDPTRVPAGIRASPDPMLATRAAVYARSYRRRHAATADPEVSSPAQPNPSTSPKSLGEKS